VALTAHLRDAGLSADLLAFPPGEASKNRNTRAVLEDRLVDLGLGRDGALLALGGGVVGDLVGFIAATYHRGIPYLQIPTTLLAMVDASIGGKTGHDLPGGKNLVGAFHQPSGVWSDLGTLGTLPDEELFCGFAEIVKGGAVADRGLLERLEEDAAALRRRERSPLQGAVVAAVRLKATLVSEDPQEHGRRVLLNFGHTVAHAIEAVSGFRISHGRAVAMGIAVEAELSVRRAGLPVEERDRLRELLGRFDLSTSVPAQIDAADLWEACGRDKKSRKGTVRCVLLRRLGEPAGSRADWLAEVGREELLDALASVR
jgi:3-dehydroquinate synthase